ncbi:MAG TPA: NrfD/PsrC family molybdoenzyme membrane anchor subunit, partial [Bryobacteraceae bacterium]
MTTTLAPPVRSESAIEPLAQPSGVREEGYYGLPFLKRPLWGWEISLYFFFEGVSSGAFLFSAVADLFGGKRHRNLVRQARYLACASMLPCPFLLIKDLGRPARFLHMLRILKLESPMSVGAWSLNAYGQQVTALALINLAPRLPRPLRKLLSWLPERLVMLSAIPFGLIMMAYPGVLLETTSVPAWRTTRFLGPLIAASSVSTAEAALSLVLPRRHPEMETIGQIARAAETAALAGYLSEAGPAGKSMTRGRYGPLFWIGAVGAGIVAPFALSLRRPARPRKILPSLLALAGGLALKWVLVHG